MSHFSKHPLTALAVYLATSSATLLAQPSVTGHQVFVTAFEHTVSMAETDVDGEIYRAEGADFNCTLSAFVAGLFGEDWDEEEIVWRALVSDSTSGPQQRLADFVSDSPIYDMAGVQVSEDFSAMWDGRLDHGIRLDEFREDVGGGQPVWTGSSSAGGRKPNCVDWQNSNLGGVHGIAGATDGDWIDARTVNCLFPARLYCIGPLAEFVTAFLPEDFNEDGTVNFPDFLGLSAVFGMDASQDIVIYDLDDSGQIDFPDFLQFANAFGNTTVQVSQVANVPEPSSFVIAVALLLCLARGRRLRS